MAARLNSSVVPPVPLLDLAKAYSSSLKTTLANSLKDGTDLTLKLLKAKQDLKEARQKNKSLVDTTSGAGRPN